MQATVVLEPETVDVLPFSYYHFLGGALYAVLRNADSMFAEDLHDGRHADRIKLLVFSPLYSRSCEICRDQEEKPLGLRFSGRTLFRIGSAWPELFNRLTQGILTCGSMRVGKVSFRVISVNLSPPPLFRRRMIWGPVRSGSIVTSWSDRASNRKVFLFPDQGVEAKTAADILRDNILHKWRRFSEIRPDLAREWAGGPAPEAAFASEDISVEPLCLSREEGPAYRTRLHYIKGNPVRSWRAPVAVEAPEALQRIVWACGLGQMNMMGFGLVEEIPECS